MSSLETVANVSWKFQLDYPHGRVYFGGPSNIRRVVDSSTSIVGASTDAAYRIAWALNGLLRWAATRDAVAGRDSRDDMNVAVATVQSIIAEVVMNPATAASQEPPSP